jgi:HlyD family secretion protein
MSAVPNPHLPSEQPKFPVAVPPPAPVPDEPKRGGGPWKTLIGLAVAGLLGYLGYQWATQPSTDTTVFAAVKSAKVVQGTVERVIRISGQTSARQFVNVTAPILRGPEARNSLVLTKLIKPGVLVKPGDVVAQIDGQWLLDHMDDVRDQVRQAESDVLKRKAEQSVEMDQLNQTLRVAKSNWDKAKLEYKAAEVRSDVERELLKLSMEEFEARYKQQSADVAEKKNAHAAELKILELTTERQRRHLARHDNDLKRYTIIATIGGLPVMQTTFRGGEMTQISEGDQVAPGQPFMKIVNPASMQVEGNLNQAESSDIRLGQEVRVGIDSFPGLRLKGQVSGVNSVAVSGGRQGNFVRSIPVRVQLLEMDTRVIPDLSAHGDVIIDRAGDVLSVPANALVEEAGKTFLFIRNPQQMFERREVTTGLRSHTSVAVTQGIKAGDEVRLN